MQPLEALQWLDHVGLPIEEREPALYLALKLGQILATGERDRAGAGKKFPHTIGSTTVSTSSTKRTTLPTMWIARRKMAFGAACG